MVETILRWLESLGPYGLFAAMFLEGSSIPFPGIVIVLAYGYILPLNYFNIFWIAVLMSVMYSFASMIPFFIGKRLEKLLQKKPKKGLQKAREIFNQYGEWTVALSRPFGLGNYISYVAGMSQMGLLRYLLLTFLGIFPWSFGMMILGNYLNGSVEAFKSFYVDNSYLLYITLTLLFLSMFIVLYIKNKRMKSMNLTKRGVDYIE